MTPAEGWAAQQMHMPANWYQNLLPHDIGFPISGDATATHQRDAKEEPPC